jgi:hypothetical protein
MAALKIWLYLNLDTSQRSALQIPSQWGIRLPYGNLVGGHNSVLSKQDHLLIPAPFQACRITALQLAVTKVSKVFAQVPMAKTGMVWDSSYVR